MRASFYWLSSALTVLCLAGCINQGEGNVGDNVPIETALGVQPSQLLSSTPTPACVQSGQPASTTHRAMFDAINAYRAENGLNPLTYSKRLETAADEHVQDLWQRRFFEHVNPDGKNPGDRALDAGFCHEYVGENIAAGQLSVQAVMDAWKNSPGHNANMLEPDYVYVGMGFFVDPTGRPYWGQEFAYDVPQSQ